MGAPYELVQHLCHRVLSVAGSGLLMVAQALLPVPSAWKASALITGWSACATPPEKESTHVTHCHPEARFFRAEGPRQFIPAHCEERTTGVLRCAQDDSI